MVVIQSHLVAITLATSAAWAEWPIPHGQRLVDGVLIPDEPLALGEVPVTGLQKRFPDMPGAADNPTTPAKVELGRMLFFDPIVSGKNDMSCAHCHHPDTGLTDRLTKGRGAGAVGAGPLRTGGHELTRNTPSLWNVAYHRAQFWDNRAETLEDQAQAVITNKDEMAEDPHRLVQELKAIDEYVRLFQAAFGTSNNEPITFKKVAQTLAAYERTLLAFNSKFDRYAAGDLDAFSASERRGMLVFRSVKTRCFECHGVPGFMSPDVKVIGLPDKDEDPHYGTQFKVPGLRNIALTAPYMHDGSLATLEDVIDFYAKGGGRGAGRDIRNQDGFVLGFDLTEQEKTDLIAFLHTLTDESAKVNVPKKVPSGLKVVPRIKFADDGKPIAQVAASSNQVALAAAFSAAATAAEKQTVVVKAGESIQDAVDSVDGDAVILVEPGVYHETVAVDFPGITLRGLVKDGRRPVLDGQGKLPDAVVGSGDNFLIEGFRIQNYQTNGVVISGAMNLTMRDIIVRNTGIYGLYPVTSLNVLVENCIVTEVADAAIYVGQCRGVVVRNCETYANVCGIEIENCTNALVTNCSSHDNTVGILVFVLPNLPLKTGERTTLIGNRIHNNNHPNFGPEGMIVAQAPPGVGVVVMAADHAVVTENEIFGNDSIGIAVHSLTTAYPDVKADDIEPNSDHARVFNNEFKDNGKQVADGLKKIGLQKGVDLFWDGKGQGNGWDEKTGTRFPPELPPIADRSSKQAAAITNDTTPSNPATTAPEQTAAEPGAAQSTDAPTGKVTGTVFYDGKAPDSWRPKHPPSVGEKFTKDTVVDLAALKPPQPIAVNENGGVQDVVVALINDATPALAQNANAQPPLIDQRGGVFHPNVTVIPPGGKVAFRNSDAINHNVHLMSPQQKEHNFLTKPDAEATIEFGSVPEDLVNVVCDMHAWMRAQIVVVPTPFYAVTDDHGKFTIENVPPGTYSVRFIHKRLENADEKLTVNVTPNKTTTLESKAKRASRRR
jgi:parallel beta-helix repeat protein